MGPFWGVVLGGVLLFFALFFGGGVWCWAGAFLDGPGCVVCLFFGEYYLDLFGLWCWAGCCSFFCPGVAFLAGPGCVVCFSLHGIIFQFRLQPRSRHGETVSSEDIR